MKRLSDNVIDIIDDLELHIERLHYFSEYILLIDAVNRLAEYEDTGLTPQEIEQMKARMPLHQWSGESPEKMSIFGVPVSKIMEWAKTEKNSIRDLSDIANSVEEKMMYMCGCRNCIEKVKMIIKGEVKPIENQCKYCKLECDARNT